MPLSYILFLKKNQKKKEKYARVAEPPHPLWDVLATPTFKKNKNKNMNGGILEKEKKCK
jgi:hypothetical protein